MAIDISNLVTMHIKPALLVDDARGGDLRSDIPTYVSSQIALQGWVLEEMDDQQCVYTAGLTLESLIPRLAQIFMDEIQERRAGPENVKLPDRVRFFTELRKAIEQMKTAGARAVGVALDPDDIGPSWPGCGVVKWA